VNVAPLAERVMAATRAGEIKIVPETWSKTWFNWLETSSPGASRASYGGGIASRHGSTTTAMFSSLKP
jgi:hypothetical protein